MHSFSHLGQMEDGRDVEVTILHNGDHSGDAIIVTRTVSTGHAFEVRVPAQALVAFANNATIGKAIGALEELLMEE